MPKDFRDREEAGRWLGEQIVAMVSRPCVVAGIPRGGLVVGLPIATRLRAPLTIADVRKLSAPSDPEFAFGALDEDGEAILDPPSIQSLGITPGQLDHIRAQVAAEITRLHRLYPAPPLTGFLPHSAVVLVDDGLATGLTMRASLAFVRRHGARHVTVAVPCASGPAARLIEEQADAFVCPIVVEDFLAVGAYYENFLPVTDQEVAAILRPGSRIDAPEADDPAPSAGEE